MNEKAVEQKTIDTMRMLSIDMVERAKSGHPGMPMGAAPMLYTLFSRFMKVNPKDPNWFNRDRFVLSAGHGSALLYSMLHLFGYDLTIEDLKNFRQLNSKTPGHPEYKHTAGVDATTGPLGQGIAMASGMAIAEAHLAQTYNQKSYNIVDHYTYALCGDGDLMEGVSAEAASLAGHLKLSKLIVLYDSNDVSLDGNLNMSFSESVQKRFEAYEWQVLRVEDGNDIEAIANTIAMAQAETTKPSLIEIKTVIGYGSPNKAGTSASHGAPLGNEEVEKVKKVYGWDLEPFEVPADVRTHLDHFLNKGKDLQLNWDQQFKAYKGEYPALAKEFERVINKELPLNWDQELPVFEASQGSIATRVASGKMINALAAKIPELFGGSADLGGSNNTFIKDSNAFSSNNRSGRNIWFGVREFGLASALNGMSLHGGLKLFGATFFVFSDYMRPAIRLAALMKLPVTYVFTHDSIAVGEDGPTHEPIEQLVSLRAMPNLQVIRPADAKETLAAWSIAIKNQEGPIALVLSRQNLPILENSQDEINQGVQAGAYIVKDADKKDPDAILIATGSEVSLALEAQQILSKDNIDVRVVSMPSWKNFMLLDKVEQDKILIPKIKARIAIEAGSTLGWKQFVGDKGEVFGIDHFGGSAPAKDLFNSFEFNAEHIAVRVKKMVEYLKS